MSRIDLSNPWQRSEAARMIRDVRARGPKSNRATTLHFAALRADHATLASPDPEQVFRRRAYAFIAEALASAV